MNTKLNNLEYNWNSLDVTLKYLLNLHDTIAKHSIRSKSQKRLVTWTKMWLFVVGENHEHIHIHINHILCLFDILRKKWEVCLLLFC